MTARLRKLLSEVKLPWRQCGADRGGCICGQVWSTSADVPVADAFKGDKEVGKPSEETIKLHAALIAEGISALPGLLDENERLKAALKELLGVAEIGLMDVDGEMFLDETRAICKAKAVLRDYGKGEG